MIYTFYVNAYKGAAKLDTAKSDACANIFSQYLIASVIYTSYSVCILYSCSLV